ncbi:hypothetical protein KC351_g14866, partial [Hortaea werneckii]
SPPRFADRRGSSASIFDGRAPGPPPRASEGAPRGPRFGDGPTSRQPPSNLGPGNAPRPGGYTSLRDAPPLGTIERARPFRDRDYDRRERLTSPRERSPPRKFSEARDYPPRELDVGRAPRRDSRDGPPSAGSTFSDALPLAPPPTRGGFGTRGRGRGDYDSFRGGRGGRRHFDGPDLFRRDRSPPPPPASQRWGRDILRESRELDRRDDRRPFERRDDDRRPDWVDREREIDRGRRESRLEARHSNESLASGSSAPQAPQALPIDPGRLALLEQAGADLSVKKQSAAQGTAPYAREASRNAPEVPSYLNGRAETMANRYNPRGSSPPAHAAPAVPAFTLSFAPSGPSAASQNNAPSMNPPKAPQEPARRESSSKEASTTPASRPQPPPEAPAPPKDAPPAPKAELAEPPPTAPKAPRALDPEPTQPFGSRLHGVRSLDNFSNGQAPNGTGPPSNAPRADSLPKPSLTGPKATSPAQSAPAQPATVPPVSPNAQSTRFGDQLAAPTGPRASRVSPAQASISPRPNFPSPRPDATGFQAHPGVQRRQTPPPSAPSGPRNRSYSVSPKVTSSTIPTAPKGIRGPPTAPRGGERAGGPPLGRGQDRPGAPTWAPPTAPRGLQAPQWNQWRRPGAPAYGENKATVPAKRDFAGDEKDRQTQNGGREVSRLGSASLESKRRTSSGGLLDPTTSGSAEENGDRMDVDRPNSEQTKHNQGSAHSAARSFFGKPAESREEEPSISDNAEEPISSSEEEEMDLEEDLALFTAKFERQKRLLEAEMADLSSREYRATTPLESIARLARISEADLQRLREQHEQHQSQHEHHEVEVSKPTGPRAKHAPNQAPSPPPAVSVEPDRLAPPTNSSGSDEGPEALTPKGEEGTDVEIRNDDDERAQVQARRERRRPSPEIITLPYLVKDAQRFPVSEVVEETSVRQADTRDDVFVALRQEAEDEDRLEEHVEMTFKELYRRWRQECEIFDKERDALDRMERQQSAEPEVEMQPPPAPPVNPIEQGRRLHKFSSEYEIEKVLKESEETARLEQERLDRETKKLQADMEKEARVPDQQTKEKFMRGAFVDANRLRAPEELTMAFSYEPQPDTFTEEEQRIFIAAFKETPKKWGEIASLLPDRTYKDCIHHYYANKWDGRFRDNRTRKFKGNGRRGRGGKGVLRGKGSAAMADMTSKAEDLGPPNVSESGRPKRAAAPTTFGEKELDAKNALTNPSPAKKPGPGGKQEANGEPVSDRPGKRRKGTGEKPGRKPKNQQPLAQLAAAPSAAASPNKSFLPQHQHHQHQHAVPSKEELARAQSIEDAALLTGFQSGQHGMMPREPQMVYHHHEPFVPAPPMNEDTGPPKATSHMPPSKTSASSYWSVPEQTDFAKYIAHFGTDFAAIAGHMGTKTQTMIKNHYQRQIDSGNRPELQQQAMEADKRREAGEDLGPPPTPTPIVKRKYDNPQPTVSTGPRPLAPHTTDAMDVDEPQSSRAQTSSKHVSPPQYQAQPRFASSAQATPIPAHRVAQSPGSSNVSPAITQVQPTAAPGRPMPHPLGQRLAFLPETRPESRPGMPATSAFRLNQDPANRGTSGQSPVPDQQYIRNLVQEQQRALQMQEQSIQQERMDQIQRHGSMPRTSLQGSPANQPLPQPPIDRKPLLEERAPTPPRSQYGQSPFSRASIGQVPFGPLGQAGMNASLLGRPAFGASTPKIDESSRPEQRQEPRADARPTSVPSSIQPTPQPTATAPAAAAEPPKRSNLMSILNADAEEPKPAKREDAAAVPQRVASPAPPPQLAATPGPQQGASLPPRREFSGSSANQPLYGRANFGQSHTPNPQQTQVKQESSAATPTGQPPKPDWASHVLSGRQPGGQPQGSGLPAEKEGRPFFAPHRSSAFGQLNQPTRANPSPPPHPVIGHSRTPSLTTQPHQPPPREQHPALQGQQPLPVGRGPAQQPLHANPYAQPPGGTPFSQPPIQQVPSHAHHGHSGSIGGGFNGGVHSRAPSRGEIARHEQIVAQREREDFEIRRMQDHHREFERHRDAQMYAQRQQQIEAERQHHQAYARGGPPPPPMHPGHFGGHQPFPPPRASLRDQAMRDAEVAIQEEEHRRRSHVMQAQQHQAHEDERRRFEMDMQREREYEYMRRQGEPVYRRTPLGGSFAHPPPPRR